MPINRAIKGAVVPSTDLQGYDWNNLIDRGVISPRTGGQSFEFLQDYNFEDNAASSGQQAFNSTANTRSGISTDLQTLQTEVQRYQDQLAAAQKQREAEINAAYETERINTSNRQRGETGNRTMFLAGAGALGRTLSAQGNLQQLQQAHDEELSALQAKKQGLLNQATAAFADKNFQLVQYKLAQARQLRQDEQSLIEKKQQYDLQLAQDKRNQATFEMNKQKSEFDLAKDRAVSLAAGLVKMNGDNIEQPSTEELQSIASQYKIDPYILEQAVQTNIANINKLKTDNFKTYLDLAMKLDKGQEVTAPDGTIIKGIKETDNIITYEANIGGIKYKVGADKKTGKVLWQNNIGKGTSSGGSGSGGGEKKITWDQAKQLGDISLYNKPVAEIYKKPETLSFQEWGMEMNTIDPQNYPLHSSPELFAEYNQYLNEQKSIAEKFNQKLDTGGNTDYAIDMIKANPGADETELIQAIIQDTGMTYAQAAKLVKDNLQ